MKSWGFLLIFNFDIRSINTGGFSCLPRS